VRTEADRKRWPVKNLIELMNEFRERDNAQYYNIGTLKLLSAKNGLRALAEGSR